VTTPLTTPLKKSTSCPRCAGTGWVTTDAEDPGATLRRCSCYASQDVERRLKNSLIPSRYQRVELSNFSLYSGIDGTLEEAQLTAEKFAKAYPDQKDPGLLFQGPSGVGKTHLAVAVLRKLVTSCGVTGRFVDYRDLLRSIQNSYNPVSETSELEILHPVLHADILLLDELGTRRPTDWVRDTVTQILNDRYKRERVTLITTNYEDDDADASIPTLAERIGPYARSRLYEMCRKVPMHGKDFRQITGRGTVHNTDDQPKSSRAASRPHAH